MVLARGAARDAFAAQAAPPGPARRAHCAAAAGRAATGRVPGAGCGDGGGAGAEPAGLPQPPRLILRPQYRRGDCRGRPAAAGGRGFFLSGRRLRRRRPPACRSPSRGAPAWPPAGSAAGTVSGLQGARPGGKPAGEPGSAKIADGERDWGREGVKIRRRKNES